MADIKYILDNWERLTDSEKSILKSIGVEKKDS